MRTSRAGSPAAAQPGRRATRSAHRSPTVPRAEPAHLPPSGLTRVAPSASGPASERRPGAAAQRRPRLECPRARRRRPDPEHLDGAAQLHREAGRPGLGLAHRPAADLPRAGRDRPAGHHRRPVLGLVLDPQAAHDACATRRARRRRPSGRTARRSSPRASPTRPSTGLVYPPGRKRGDGGEDLSVICPMCDIGRDAAVDTCGNCGLVLKVEQRPRVVAPIAPPPGGAAIA